MNCKNCGTPLSPEQKFCPNCGSSIENNNYINNFDSSTNVPTGLNNRQVYDVNKPGDIGFNRDMEQDLNQFGANNPYENRDNMIATHKLGNNINNGFSGSELVQINPAMTFNDNGKGNKRKFPWIGLAIGIVVLIFVGVFLLPIFNQFNMKTYETDDYVLEYNANWDLDDDEEKMTLYYSDKDSRFILNAISTFASLNFQVESETDKKTLYEAFYKAWSAVDGGELTGGTDTFLTLTDDSMYARVDYKMNDRENVGSFYVVINKKKDKVISFMSYCTQDNWKKIDKDIMKMLESLTYISEADSSYYEKFSEGDFKEYTSIGYMDYKVPECWTLDEERTKANQYKSYIFKFRDGVSLLDIKGVTPYDSQTMQAGTTYEKMKASIINKYGAIKKESMKTINDKVWYVVITPDYTSGGKSYHNEIYFALSANNTNLYYIEAYVSNDTSKEKTKYFNDSIEYILKSAVLYKDNE